MHRTSKALWALSAALLLGLLIYLQSTLPETIPTHFNIRGEADHFGKKSQFLALMGIIALFMNLLFLALRMGIGRMSNALINWPNKDWWMATPERQELMHVRVRQMLEVAAIVANFTFIIVLGMTAGLSSTLGMGLIAAAVGVHLFFLYALTRRPK